MKFIIHKKELVRAFGVAEGATSKKSPMPILANVKIVADSAVSFCGTDLTVIARSTAEAKVTTPGAVLVPGSQFLAAARAMPDGEVTVRIDGPRVELAGGKARQRVGFSDADEYPVLVVCDVSLASNVPAAALAEAIGCVAHSAATDEVRANLAGVQVGFYDGAIRAQASNGYVFARRDIPVDVSGPDAFLPTQSLREVRRFLASVDGSVAYDVQDGHAHFVSGSASIAAKLTGEKFPSVESLIPKGTAHRVVVNRDALLDAFKRVSTAADDATAGVELVIAPGSIGLRSESAKGTASASDEVSCDYAGPGIVTGARGAYAIAALGALTSDEIAVVFNRPIDPILFVPANAADHVQLVMPQKM